MSRRSYRFKLGELECVSLTDGTVDYPLQNFFTNVRRPEVEAALRQHNLPIDYVTTPCTCLFVNTGAHRALVDMGAGNMAATTGRLVQNMKTAAIDPGEIDTVIITHAHPDHVGGALDDEGRLVYPSAHYFIWKDEWEFWFSKIAEARAPERFVMCARRNLALLRDRVTLLDRESELVPGIRAIAAPGHTPGHMVVQVSSAGKLLLYVGDTVLHPLHLEHPDWTPIYDIVPEEAAASKRRIFDLAAEERTLAMGQHFPPFPSLGYVVKMGEAWRWEPTGTTGQEPVKVA